MTWWPRGMQNAVSWISWNLLKENVELSMCACVHSYVHFVLGASLVSHIQSYMSWYAIHLHRIHDNQSLEYTGMMVCTDEESSPKWPNCWAIFRSLQLGQPQQNGFPRGDFTIFDWRPRHDRLAKTISKPSPYKLVDMPHENPFAIVQWCFYIP